MECAIHTTNQKIPPLTNPSLVRGRKGWKSLKPISMASIVSTAGFISCGGLNRSSGRSSTTFGTQLAYPLSSSFGGGCSRRLKPAVVVVRAEAQHVNPEIRKGEEKVVDTVLVPELSKPLTVYCRCWRSGTFPLCDGSHVKHNKATGDNVGPLLVKKQ